MSDYQPSQATKAGESVRKANMAYYYHAAPMTSAERIQREGIREGNIYLSSSIENEIDFMEQVYLGAPGAAGKAVGVKKWAIFRTEHPYGEFPFELYADYDWGIPGVYVGRGKIPRTEVRLVGKYTIGTNKVEWISEAVMPPVAPTALEDYRYYRTKRERGLR